MALLQQWHCGRSIVVHRREQEERKLHAFVGSLGLGLGLLVRRLQKFGAFRPTPLQDMGPFFAVDESFTLKLGALNLLEIVLKWAHGSLMGTFCMFLGSFSMRRRPHARFCWQRRRGRRPTA